MISIFLLSLPPRLVLKCDDSEEFNALVIALLTTKRFVECDRKFEKRVFALSKKQKGS